MFSLLGAPQSGNRQNITLVSGQPSAQLIHELTIALLEHGELDEFLYAVLTCIKQELKPSTSAIWLLDREGDLVRRTAQNEPARLDRSEQQSDALLRAALRSGRAVVGNSDDTIVKNAPMPAPKLCVPIRYANTVLGAIRLDRSTLFSLQDLNTVGMVATLVAGKIAYLELRDTPSLPDGQEARESRHFVQEIIDTAPNVLYVLDYQTKVMVEGLDKFAAFFGFSVEEIEAMDQGVYTLVHPDDLATVAQQDEALRESRRQRGLEQVVAVELRLCDRQGNWHWCVVSRKVFKRGPQGTPLMEIGSVHDVTALKNAEAALRDSEARYRALFENSFDSIVLYDAKANIQYTSPSTRRFLGYREDEVVGRNALDFVVKEDRAAVKRLWNDLLRRPGGNAITEQRIRHQDGRSIWVEARMANMLHNPQVGGIVSNFHDITDRKHAQQRIYRLANYDTLTQLPNRRLLSTVLQQALGGIKSAPLALLYIDLDRFKNVNDTLGHHVGDQLLIAAAERMASILPGYCQLARLGGDEFAVLMVDTNLKRADQLAANLVAALEQPMHIDDYDIRVTASIGIALSPQHGNDVDDLFKHADIAMYRAKQVRNRRTVFRHQDARRMSARVEMEKALQLALDESKLQLHYQPQICLQSGSIDCVEALLRWPEDDTSLMPGVFIPIAEETGLIYRIGQWVLNAACAQIKQWQQQGWHGRVAINLSARELQIGNIATQVDDALRLYALPPSKLELEITETAVMTDLERSLRTLSSLREIGVRLSIDDFGTGYSSLYYLRRLPVNGLKIDQSFLPRRARDKSSRELYRSIVNLGQSVGLDLIAEGIESASHHALVQAAGCDHAQGYYYAKPSPPAAVDFSASKK